MLLNLKQTESPHLRKKLLFLDIPSSVSASNKSDSIIIQGDLKAKQNSQNLGSY